MRLILSAWLLLLAFTSPTHAQSPREEIHQLVTQLQATPGDTALRERIIRLAREIKPPPALPEEAERRLVRGAAAFKLAKNSGDYKDAAREFELASNTAPWSGDIYYNLALAHDKAGDYAAAIAALRWAVAAAPDNREVRNLLYETEFKQERTEKEKSAAMAEADRKRAALRVLDLLRGTYYGNLCSMRNDLTEGCDEAQRRGNNWYRFRWEGSTTLFSFTILGDGSVQAPTHMEWAQCNVASNPVVGTLSGTELNEIIWTVRPPNSPPRRIWSEAASDGSWITFSCDRPLENANPGTRYRYVTYFRP